MALFATLSGWATFGVLVRAYQNGIRKVDMLYAPMGYAYSAGFWVALGYGFTKWTEKNELLLDKRLEKLNEARATASE
ncbi:unnamed protein product [Kuraishia capsulata CBS 1993]|uniref:Uncharacterized protein n=1 Tax=Kuraishia capsulata CBS 1993 TaxID=1382522 RepID=W6MV35_9ASCO|nr:uncharacterized protein KUCA_T00002016001 [Kuraishia capsulata CBS 1993]CDK26045.1 unnamed protein product [Kuraishia capsulata CBS 1993]